MSSKSSGNGDNQNSATTATSVLDPNSEAVPVRAVNSFQDDYLKGIINGRKGGFTFAFTLTLPYSTTQYTSVLPYLTAGQTVTLLAAGTNTGSTQLKMASTSTQDSPSGTGVSSFIAFMMLNDFSIVTEIVTLNGTTPVNMMTQNVYHFMYALPLSGGTSFPTQNIIAGNVGAVFLGSGTWSNSTAGFTTNYMWTAPFFNALSSGVFVCPKGYVAAVTDLKYNSYNVTAAQFVFLLRSSRSVPFAVNALDNVALTTVINRTNPGYAPAGSEYTVVATGTAAGSIPANFFLQMDLIRQEYLLPVSY
jgi:hypothetical protein